MEHGQHAFEWGSYDCATLWRDCVLAITGKDLLAGARPWHNEWTAYRALLALGYATQEDIFRTHAVRIERAAATRGCLAFVAPTIPIAGPAIVLGDNGLMVSRNPERMVVVSVENAETFYRVD